MISDDFYKSATLLTTIVIALFQARALRNQKRNANETRSNLTELARSVNGAKTAAEAAAKAAGYFEGQAPQSDRGDELSAQAHHAADAAQATSAAAEIEIARDPNKP
jgi:hypothetical protein